MPPNNRQGFTLIEVLVAMIIIAIALLGVTSGVNNSINSTTHLNQQMGLSWAAQNLYIRCNTGALSLVDAAKNPQQINMFGQQLIGEVKIKDSKKAADKVTITVKSASDPRIKYSMQAIVAKRIVFDDH
jgi:type II secretion system protein I